MVRRKIAVLAVLFVAICAVLIGCTALIGAPVQLEEAIAEDVVDGDTIVVRIGTETAKVRLIGIDAPELNAKLGDSAKARVEQLVLNKTVYLEYDAERTDNYGRLLAYVWIEKPSSQTPTAQEIGSKMLNGILLLEGLASTMEIKPNTKYSTVFASLQSEAIARRIGIWKVEEQQKQITVYITKTGKKYHRYGCRYLQKSCIPISLDEAKRRGYTPCSVCNPPY